MFVKMNPLRVPGQRFANFEPDSRRCPCLVDSVGTAS